MPAEDSFADLMARLRAGDDDAAARVFRRFTHRLMALARARLGGRLRQKVDPEDVLQSVYKSFFLRHAEGQLEVAGWDSLWSLLALITARKCGRWAEHFRAGRRDLRAEVAVVGRADESGVIEAFSADPSPAEAAMLSEVMEQLLRDLDERDRTILTLALQGSSAPEISEQLDRPARTVYRVLERIRRRLEAAQTDAPPAP
jgi:RNA polymerase sigma-70 factor (ECF subfamily)